LIAFDNFIGNLWMLFVLCWCCCCYRSCVAVVTEVPYNKIKWERTMLKQ